MCTIFASLCTQFKMYKFGRHDKKTQRYSLQCYEGLRELECFLVSPHLLKLIANYKIPVGKNMLSQLQLKYRMGQ